MGLSRKSELLLGNSFRMRRKKKKNVEAESYTQWSTHKQGKFIPCFQTVRTVPPGVYEMKSDQNIGFHIELQSHVNDELIQLPIPEIKEILRDIDNFWKREDMFKKYGYTFKRGILLYGPPGNGKSMLLQSLSQKLIGEMDGIVFNLRDHNDIELYLEYAGPVLRAIEKDRPIIVILEDIDNIIHGSRSTLTGVLNMLDGIKQIDKVVYLACPAPETRILKSNLTWVRADELTPGDELIGFDENGPNRKYKPSKVNSCPIVNRKRFKVITDSGEIIVSEKHPFLIRLGNRPFEWRMVEDLRPGNKIVSIGKPWETGNCYEVGYIAGQYDGEGCLMVADNKKTKANGFRLTWSQTIKEPHKLEIVKNFKKILKHNGFKTYISYYKPKNKKHSEKAVIFVGGGKWENLRLIGMFRPHRFLNHPKLSAGWNNCRLCPKNNTEVISIESIGEGPVVALDTSTKTFIGEGMLQHNTTNYPELLQERISNRPSRFDRRYKIGLPNSKVRESYISQKLKKDDLEKINIKDWVKKSNGFSLAAIKELIVSVIILNIPLDEAVGRLKEMKNKLQSDGEGNQNQKKLGFTFTIPRDEEEG